jgi:hypothetical protein
MILLACIEDLALNRGRVETIQSSSTLRTDILLQQSLGIERWQSDMCRLLLN